MKTFSARTGREWREWLSEHHGSESEVWLVFYKRHTGRPCVSYDEAVEEALCFGWIDSVLRRLDDRRYARKFTPRRPDSRWSTANRRRYAKLRARGLLTAAGRRRAPTARSGDAPRVTAEAPPYIEQALRRMPAAWTHFGTLAPSSRRAYIGWIDSAKREDTRARRLREAAALLAAGKKLGLK